MRWSSPISVRATSAWIVAVGVAKITNVSAPCARSATTWAAITWAESPKL